MGNEYIIISMIRLALLFFSIFAISHNVLPIKAAWQENNTKKMHRSITWLWAGLLAGCMFLKMFAAENLRF